VSRDAGRRRLGQIQRKEKGGQLGVARRITSKLAEMGCRGPPEKAAPTRARLFEFFGHDGELELGLGKRLHDNGFGAFRGGVTGSGHFADEEILRAFEHFLFAEGERLAAAEGDEALQDDGDFEEGPGAHTLGVLLEAVFPIVMRVEFALLEEAKDFGCVIGTNDGTKANGLRVCLRNHHAKAAGNNANHEVTFGSTVQKTVANLLNEPNAVVRIYDLVADLVVHSFGCPPDLQKLL